MQVEARYDSIEIAEMLAEELERTGLVGLAPLWLLTRDGATRAIFNRAFDQLEAARKPEGLSALHLIATAVFENSPADLEWVEWRFATMQDYLFENSKMYKDLIKEGRIKDFEEGRAQGIRESIEAVVQERFPRLLELARERAKQVQSQEALQRLLVAVSAAPSESKARRYLLALREEE